MRHKKLWTDRQGALGLAVTAVIAILIIAVAALAVIVVGAGAFPLPGYDPPLKDGDTKEEHPIFAYFDISAKIHFDNTQFNTGTIWGLDGITVNVESSASEVETTSFLEKFSWFGGQSCDYTVKFKISGPTQAEYSYPRTVTGTQQVNANQLLSVDVPMGAAPGIRYEGSYLVTVTLLDDTGKEIRTISETVQVSK